MDSPRDVDLDSPHRTPPCRGRSSSLSAFRPETPSPPRRRRALSLPPQVSAPLFEDIYEEFLEWEDLILSTVRPGSLSWEESWTGSASTRSSWNDFSSFSSSSSPRWMPLDGWDVPLNKTVASVRLRALRRCPRRVRRELQRRSRRHILHPVHIRSMFLRRRGMRGFLLLPDREPPQWVRECERNRALRRQTHREIQRQRRRQIREQVRARRRRQARRELLAGQQLLRIPHGSVLLRRGQTSLYLFRETSLHLRGSLRCQLLPETPVPEPDTPHPVHPFRRHLHQQHNHHLAREEPYGQPHFRKRKGAYQREPYGQQQPARERQGRRHYHGYF